MEADGCGQRGVTPPGPISNTSGLEALKAEGATPGTSSPLKPQDDKLNLGIVSSSPKTELICVGC